MPAGVILAGGRSSRMGRPKARLPVGGVPMIVRVASRLAEVCDELLVVTNDPSAAELVAARVVPDDRPDQGPLAGLAAGLKAATSHPCVVVACDMPFVEPSALARLLERAEGTDAVVPREPGGRVQPLHAVYSGTCLEAVSAALAGGERSVTSFLDRISVRYVDGLDDHSWWNVNTPQDLESAERRASPSAPGCPG